MQYIDGFWYSRLKSDEKLEKKNYFGHIEIRTQSKIMGDWPLAFFILVKMF